MKKPHNIFPEKNTEVLMEKTYQSHKFFKTEIMLEVNLEIQILCELSFSMYKK